MRFERVLFDLDGTLTDPSEGITRCIAYALDLLDLEPSELRHLERHIGPPLIETFAELGVPEEQLVRAVELFRERFREVGIYENKMYEGVDDLLSHLADLGIGIYLATSKPEVFAERILEHFDLARYFTEVAGATLDGSRLDKADVIAHALRNVTPTSTVMVGDRKHDLIGAAQHGLPAIAVTWGFGSHAELAAETPLAIVSTIDELDHELSN